MDFRFVLKNLYKKDHNKYGINPDILLYTPERSLTPPDNQESNVFLTGPEFKQLYNYEPKNERLQKAKDIYIWLIATSLASGDRDIDPRFDIKDGVIIKGRKKNRSTPNAKPQIIPLNKFSSEILAKYPEGLPKISSQKLNDYIKEVAREAGINSLVRIVSYPGGERKEGIFEKWQVLTTHTGRKTMTTWLEMEKTPDTAINNIIGHSSNKQRKHYSGLDMEALKKYVKDALPEV